MNRHELVFPFSPFLIKFISRNRLILDQRHYIKNIWQLRQKLLRVGSKVKGFLNDSLKESVGTYGVLCMLPVAYKYLRNW